MKQGWGKYSKGVRRCVVREARNGFNLSNKEQI